LLTSTLAYSRIDSFDAAAQKLDASVLRPHAPGNPVLA